jgi:c-di-GMP-binding flagellar brake protein YcgR
MNFYLKSPEIVSRGSDVLEKEFVAQFDIRETQYSFPARIEAVFERHEMMSDCVLCKILAPIKGRERREDFRIQIALRMRIHAYSPDVTKFHVGENLCDCVSVDVSKNGMSVWCDYALPEEMDAQYTLEFKLNSGRIYLVPAKLRRHSRNTETRSYHYAYGFLFDFSSMPSKQEELLLDILEHKIRSK